MERRFFLSDYGTRELMTRQLSIARNGEMDYLIYKSIG